MIFYFVSPRTALVVDPLLSNYLPLRDPPLLLCVPFHKSVSMSNRRSRRQSFGMLVGGKRRMNMQLLDDPHLFQ